MLNLIPMRMVKMTPEEIKIRQERYGHILDKIREEWPSSENNSSVIENITTESEHTD